MSRRRPMSDLLAFRNALGRVPSGYGERHVRKVWFGTGEARLCSLVSKDRRYKPVVKSDGAQRETGPAGPTPRPALPAATLPSHPRLKGGGCQGGAHADGLGCPDRNSAGQPGT